MNRQLDGIPMFHELSRGVARNALSNGSLSPKRLFLMYSLERNVAELRNAKRSIPLRSILFVRNYDK